jgi:hypothetical protein
VIEGSDVGDYVEDIEDLNDINAYEVEVIPPRISASAFDGGALSSTRSGQFIFVERCLGTF